jgi:hypothetical protein
LIITRKSQVLLNFLDVRVVVNGNRIYPLQKEQPVQLFSPSPKVALVVSDGFHITPNLAVALSHQKPTVIHITCAIDDGLFYAGLLLTLIFLLVGLISDFFVGKILCFFPVFYFLYWYYLRRPEFIRVMLTTSTF